MTKHDAARKQRIVEYIATRVRETGYPPSVREIAKAVDLASTSAVHHHLQALEREGYLERGASHSRAIRVTPTAAMRSGVPGSLMPQMAAQSRTFPVIGEIAAGGPIEAYQDASETMSIPDAVVAGGDAYVLRVRGDSMIDAHITDGDYVVIRPQANRPRRRHRGRPGRRERGHPQALLQGEEPGPAPAGQRPVPAPVL